MEQYTQRALLRAILITLATAVALAQDFGTWAWLVCVPLTTIAWLGFALQWLAEGIPFGADRGQDDLHSEYKRAQKKKRRPF